MKEFEELLKICRKLSDEEVKRFQNENWGFLVKGSLVHGLLENIIDHPELSNVEVQKRLYGKVKKDAFRKLVQRTKEIVLDYLISNNSVDNYIGYDLRSRSIMTLLKRLIQYDILIQRNLSSIALPYLNRVINISKAYEYYDVLVLALYKKLRITGLQSTLDEYQNQIDEIKFYEDCRNSYHKSELYIKSLYEHLNDKRKLLIQQSKIEKIVTELEQDYERTKSKSTLYNLYVIKSEKYSLLDLPDRCNFIWRQMIHIVTSSKTLNSNHGLGMAYINCAATSILIFRFDDAYIELRKAYPLAKSLDSSVMMVYNYQFLLHYFSPNPKLIENYLDLLNTYLYSGVLVHYFAATVKYYNACVKFIQAEYGSSFMLLNDVKALEQDKETWNIAIRVLSILNQIELENFEIADNLIENLRKHHERVRKDLPVSKRDEKIIQILTSLSRNSYNFRITFKRKEEAFNMLDSLEKSYRWKILSPEMIIFHEWFRAKVAGNSYSHFEIMPRMKKKYSVLYKAFVPLEDDVHIA